MAGEGGRCIIRKDKKGTPAAVCFGAGRGGTASSGGEGRGSKRQKGEFRAKPGETPVSASLDYSGKNHRGQKLNKPNTSAVAEEWNRLHTGLALVRKPATLGLAPL